VRVHEAGDDGAAAGVDLLVGRRRVRRATDPRDRRAVDDQGGVRDRADEVLGVGVVGDQLADVRDDGRGVFREGDREQLGRDLDTVIGRIWL